MVTIRSLKPGLQILRFCGYFPHKISDEGSIESSDKFRNYSIGLAVIFLCLGICSIVFQELKNELESTVYFILLVLVYFTIFFSLVESVWKRNDQRELLENFQAIDLSLEKEFFRPAQAHLRGHFLRRIFAALFVLFVTLLINIIIFWEQQDPKEFIKMGFYFIGYSLSGLRYFQIIYFTLMIRKRLEFLNKTLDKLVEERNEPIKTVSFKGTIQSVRFLQWQLKGPIKSNKIKPHESGQRTHRKDLTDLEVLREVYHKLWINSQLFNKAFGMSLLANIGYDFLALTSDLYWIIVSFNTVVASVSPTPALYVATVNAFPHFLNVILICAICHYTIISGKDVSMFINKFDTEMLSEAENLWVQQFSLQMVHQKVLFSANGFFDIDFTLLFTIIGSCTTYLVILVQFRISEFTTTPTN